MSRRIVIFGAAASGKSTLARRLGEVIGCDVLELDHVRWNEDRSELNSLATCREIIGSFASERENWIVEGLHSSLLSIALNLADEVHFLNPPFEVCMDRALARPWEPKKSSSPESHVRIVHESEPWFRSYDTRTDETSLQAHRMLFDEFLGTKLEHIEEDVQL